MASLIEEIRTRAEPFADALLAAALTLFAWLQISAVPIVFQRRSFGRPIGPGFNPDRGPFFIRDIAPSPLDYLLIAACFLPLMLRRRYPLTVLGVVTVAAALFDRFPHPPTITFLAPLVALYTVGTLRDRRTLVISGAAALLVTLVLTLPATTDTRFFADLMRIVAMFAVAGALGVAVQSQRAYVAEVEQRAAEVERTHEEEARRRVDEERLRIARELHDITAHSLSIIAVQAGAAEHVLLRDPGSAARALETIRETASRSLDELRALVGVLRGADEEVDSEPATREPAPSLLGLPDLVRAVEDAGVHVDLDVSEDLGDLPAFVDLSAYRIVQEALTNVVRHAEAKNVRLSIRRENGTLVILVEDDGRGVETVAIGEGHGISGMAERAAALDGTLEAGPIPEGGFRVLARLPTGRRGVARE